MLGPADDAQRVEIGDQMPLHAMARISATARRESSTVARRSARAASLAASLAWPSPAFSASAAPLPAATPCPLAMTWLRPLPHSGPASSLAIEGAWSVRSAKTRASLDRPNSDRADSAHRARR